MTPRWTAPGRGRVSWGAQAGYGTFALQSKSLKLCRGLSSAREHFEPRAHVPVEASHAQQGGSPTGRRVRDGHDLTVEGHENSGFRRQVHLHGVERRQETVCIELGAGGAQLDEPGRVRVGADLLAPEWAD